MRSSAVSSHLGVQNDRYLLHTQPLRTLAHQHRHASDTLIVGISDSSYTTRLAQHENTTFNTINCQPGSLDHMAYCQEDILQLSLNTEASSFDKILTA